MSVVRLLRRGSLVLVTGTLAAAVAAPATAQQVVGLEEVVVTARKREENLQDVALSITAFQAAELERLNDGSISDGAARDSSLSF